VGPLQNALTDI